MRHHYTVVCKLKIVHGEIMMNGSNRKICHQYFPGRILCLYCLIWLIRLRQREREREKELVYIIKAASYKSQEKSCRIRKKKKMETSQLAWAAF